MKVQCDVCETAAATLLCCADEAALCAECDKQVHAANKLAGKHERVPFIGLHPSSCDICQEKLGHFFCVEDRALLCRDCDVSIHTTNKLVRKHKRFLVSGVQVGLDAMVPQPMAPQPSPLPHLVCNSSTTNSISNIDTMETMQQRISNPQQSIWPSHPPPLIVCKANSVENIHINMQTVKHIAAPNPHETTWPSPLISPITFSSPPHPHQLASPPSTYLSGCLAHLDELLNINTTTNFTETPSRMSIPNVGWNLPNNTLAWDVENASSYLFEDSLAQVPSTPSPSIEYQVSFKRKRPVHELTHSTLDHTLLVPNNIFPPFLESKISFYGGGIG